MAAKIKDAFDVDSELIEGSNGIFDILVDGAMIFSKGEAGRFPEHDEVLDALQGKGLDSR